MLIQWNRKRMNISIDSLFANSWCLTISNEKYRNFIRRLKAAARTELVLPRPLYGIKSSKESIQQIFGKKAIPDIRCLFVTAEHYFLVRMAKELKLPFVAIFEDDASPHKMLLEKLNYYLTDIPEDLDCLRLGYSRTIDRFAKEKAISIDSRFMQRNVYGSHSYIVFSKYYDSFLAIDDPLCLIDDLRINPYSGHKIFLTKEPLFIQWDSLEDKEKIHAVKEKWYYDRYSSEIVPSNYIA